ncbi:MAG: hypothetical protein Q7T03_11110 [Deltaproteobacteria bacterium]|nr:hypothetical protein [Deltaproteobacteria bacterium]
MGFCTDKPALKGLNPLEQDLLTRYYDEDRISSQDEVALFEKYSSEAEQDQLRTIFTALADDYLSPEEMQDWQEKGISDSFIRSYENYKWVACASEWVNKSFLRKDLTLEARKQLIADIGHFSKSNPENGAPGSEVAVPALIDGMRYYKWDRESEKEQKGIRSAVNDALSDTGSLASPLLLQTLKSDDDRCVLSGALMLLRRHDDAEYVDAKTAILEFREKMADSGDYELRTQADSVLQILQMRRALSRSTQELVSADLEKYILLQQQTNLLRLQLGVLKDSNNVERQITSIYCEIQAGHGDTFSFRNELSRLERSLADFNSLMTDVERELRTYKVTFAEVEVEKDRAQQSYDLIIGALYALEVPLLMSEIDECRWD